MTDPSPKPQGTFSKLMSSTLPHPEQRPEKLESQQARMPANQKSRILESQQTRMLEI
jgi:hypothetical protein